MISPQSIPVRDRGVRTDPAAPSMPRGSPLHEKKPPSRMDLAARVLAAADAIARHQQKETHEAASPENDDGCVTTECQTKNRTGKAVAKTVPDASASSASQSATGRAGASQDPARAATASTGAAKTRATSTRNLVLQRVMQPPTPAQPAIDEPALSTSSDSTVCASVPTGLKKPNDVVPKAECRDILKFIGPKAVHMKYEVGAHLPAHIPREIELFIKDVRTCVNDWPSYTKTWLHCVEYHSGTWFVAAGFFAYLHRTENDKGRRNHAGYEAVREEIQKLLLNLKKVGKLHKINVGNDKLAPGLEAGKGGNNGGKNGTWFVRPDVDFADLAERAKLAAVLAKPASRG
ncbi:hypothetical protein GGF31_007345 [Allomyces arbusculus]|nr:hypothetical protein GGF31_007345 [Allomyces arbusculus]